VSNKAIPVYVAGHRGMAGSALVRQLQAQGYSNIITASRAELDLTDQAEVAGFMQARRPELVINAAAKVGGIVANNDFPADFIHQNLLIQNNLIHSAHACTVKRFLFLGSSCIYPKHAPQPISEVDLLTGTLEPTNRPYALAKIAGIEMCWSYNRQYPQGTGFLAAMPTNLYGPGDNYHPTQSHVIPGLLRRFHDAKLNRTDSVAIWGTGQVRREFMLVDDMAKACIALLELPQATWETLLARDRNDGIAPLINVGTGSDITIAELAQLIAQVVGFEGKITYDRTKPDGTPRKLMNNARLRAFYSAPFVPLKEGLQLAYKDFLTNFNTLRT